MFYLILAALAAGLGWWAKSKYDRLAEINLVCEAAYGHRPATIWRVAKIVLSFVIMPVGIAIFLFGFACGFYALLVVPGGALITWLSWRMVKAVIRDVIAECSPELGAIILPLMFWLGVLSVAAVLIVLYRAAKQDEEKKRRSDEISNLQRSINRVENELNYG
ncbi:hypothetical protein SAMN05444156_2178 [Verrucomicrobium sp. GAS474]|uniref:hypothetical protein n=1 Tax=Verrucomicrobium sp. GAS474 TaxID=1882831 RepID=UPI00087D8152|nr:hypothetical protein [Verrucomicrobium sp. GAS474]SDU13686.1 hypothetical protein SAMN05444156_2178 [Verrucomicrobium sp. GAS474]